MRIKVLFIVLFCFVLIGCVSVDVTKTARGTFSPTNPNDVDILLTRPEQSYSELGTVTVTGFVPSDTAKMHNAIRAKAAPLGANAVILTNEGILPPQGFRGATKWATGVAIRFK